MPERIGRAMAAVAQPQHFKLRLFWEGNLIGVATGLIIALFRYLVETSEEALPKLYVFLQAEPFYLFFWLGTLFLSACLLQWIMCKDGMVAGSGIPQIKGILLGQMDMHWARVLTLKFFGSLIGIATGMSLGRAGPSVQLGACVGQGLGRLTHRSRLEDHYLLTAGAGAGLAAAFNAPLAGVIFCLEELTKNFSPLVLMGAISATVTATTITQFFFGIEPVFHLGEVPVVPAGYLYGLLILSGVFVGLLGLGFNKMLLCSLDLYGRLPVSEGKKLLLPLSLSLLLGFVLPQVLGGGSLLVDSLVVISYGLPLLLILLAVKFFFTMACFGTGVPGGIFMPILVLGALGGSVFAEALIKLGLLPSVWAVDFLVFGMAAYFSAVVKAPITASVLIMEMTGSFEHLLALILVSMTAYLVADFAGSPPVYEMLLQRSLSLHQRFREKIRRHRVSLEAELASLSPVAGLRLDEVPWPQGTLVVNLVRSGTEIAPSAALVLCEGDRLQILIDENLKPELEKLLAGGK